MPSFSPVRHSSRPPDVRELLRILERREVRYVLIGSAAMVIHGVEIEPADLDVVPDRETGNLRRLTEALREVEAQPLGPFGEWTRLESGEMKWIPRPTTERELSEWTPDPEIPSSLDHLYVTRFGNFDVVLGIGGPYERLLPRASSRDWEGVAVALAHVDELLAGCTVPRRGKDIARVAKLREIQAGPGR